LSNRSLSKEAKKTDVAIDTGRCQLIQRSEYVEHEKKGKELPSGLSRKEERSGREKK